MNRFSWLTLTLALAVVSLMAACGGGGNESNDSGCGTARLEVPEDFKGKKFDGTVDAAKGKKLFKVHCETCHGTGGKGDGVQAKVLGETGPAVVDLTDASMKDVGDDYIFWHIVVGPEASKQMGSGMTAFKEILKDEADIWQIVAHVRTLSK
jgi:hypothetical protein